MLRIRVGTLILVAMCVLTSCTTLAKRAQKQMENGQYAAAAASYELLLKRDPSNAQARANLAEARSHVLADRLIDVRKQRMGGAPQAAADQLLQILSDERSWQIEPKGAATFTQQEETQYATRYLVGDLQKALAQEMPLKTEHELKTYEPLFQESDARKFADLKLKSKQQGQAHCRKLASGSFKNLPYFAEFVSRYCGYFGLHPKLAGYDVAQKQATLIRSVTLSGSIDKLPETAHAELQQQLTGALQATPWYSAEGTQSVSVPVNADWDYQFQKIPIQLVYHYQQPETYVEYQDVTKTRQVPYQVTQIVFNPQTKQNEPVQRVDYRTETYTEKEPVQKTRYVDKDFPYGAWKVLQEMKLGLKATYMVDGKGFDLVTADQSTADDTENDIEMPNIGLKKKSPDAIPDHNRWLSDHIQAFAAQMKTQLISYWTSKFCTDFKAGSLADSGNRAYECLRLPSAAANPPAEVNQWHLDTFGLPATTVAQMIGAK